jgi:hypothetical protein
MSPVMRLGIGAGLLTLWFGLISPRLSHMLLQRRSLRSGTITMPTLMLALKEMQHTGALRDVAAADMLFLTSETTAIREMSINEETLVAEIWAQVPQKLKHGALTAAQDYQGPPLPFNPRFVDPNTPALIQAVIQSYGHRRLRGPLPEVQTSASAGSRRERLQAATSLVREKALTEEAAACILDAALRLSQAQRARVNRERSIVAQLPTSIHKFADHIHQHRGPPDQ